MISLITFDLGNVMIHLAGGWENACACAGVPYRPFIFTEEDRARLREYEVEVETNAVTMSLHYTRVCHLFRHLYTVEEVAGIYQAIIREEIAGIYETVHALKRAGYRTACLSNTCAAHWTDMTNPSLYPAIGALDHQHASHLFEYAKPNPEIYRCFESATGFAPAQILFFDDRPENIEGARACGWNAVQITDADSSIAQIHDALSAYGIILDCM